MNFDELRQEIERRHAVEGAAGVARIGGTIWWHSYPDSYLRAAGMIVEQAQRNGELNDVAVPILFLQRQVLELTIKYLLGQLYEIGDAEPSFAPSKNATERLGRHDLPPLIEDLKRILAVTEALEFQLPDLPADLARLVSDFTAVDDGNHTQLRYDWVIDPADPGRRQRRKIRSFQHEKLVPIVEFQHRLVAVVDEITESRGTHKSLAECLYEIGIGYDSER